MAENADINVLKGKRKQIKSKLTRSRTYFASISNREPLIAEVAEELRLRIENVKSCLDEFSEIQSEIELLAPTEGDELERDNFEESYFEVMSKAKLLCMQDESKVESERFEVESNVTGSSNRSRSNQCGASMVKLPTTKLPVFDNKQQDWLEFRDIFKVLVDENEDLSPIQKFYYLRSSLGKDASQVIKSLDITANTSNYDTAWRLLCERFENKNLMIHSHICAIFEHPPLRKESHVELRNLYGENTDAWDRIIIYILTNKFDPVTRRDWELFKYENELPNMSDINRFLKERCEVLEKLESNKVEKKSFVKSGSCSFFSNEKSEIRCYFCGKEHTIYNCREFSKLSVESRINEINKKELCLNCFKQSHATENCRARADSEKALLQIQKDVTEILASAKFDLRKWMCNSSTLLDEFVLNDKLDVNILQIDENEFNKTLGIVWDSKQDTIQYAFSITDKTEVVCSKRSILSVICQIYD
nr:unnamed protein product [Callosobruchus analis]